MIRDLFLEVDDGEIIGLLGANGAGKTTLLRVIAGMLPFWSGRAELDGTDISRTSPWDRVRRGLAHVPEGRRVFGPMTVKENLDVAALTRPRQASVLSEIYSLFPRLQEREGQQAGSLSGGEQQMLAIGRALMTQPRVLLVDEMSAGLDPIVTGELLRGLRHAHEERGIALLLVEQNPHLLEGVVDRLYLLEQGRIVGEGTFESVGGPSAVAELYLGVHEES